MLVNEILKSPTANKWVPPSRLDMRRLPPEKLVDQPPPPHDPPIDDPANAVVLIGKK